MAIKRVDISIVIPVHNERESLAELAGKIFAVFKKRHFEVIFIDDGSTDGSFAELVRLKKLSGFQLTIVRLRRRCGKSTALAVGFSLCKGELVATLDADLQDDPGQLPKLISKLNSGYDLVLGWRQARQDPWTKVILSRIFNACVSTLSGIRLHDFNIGMKVLRRQVTREIDLYGELHRFVPLLAAARGFRVTEVAIEHHRRRYGKSKFGTGRVVRAAFDLLATLFILSFKKQPLHLFGVVGGVAAGIGVLILAYLSYLHFFGLAIGRRPLLLLGIMLVLFGVQLVSTGLLAELITSFQKKDLHPIADKL